jgi:hypothetical protein
VSRHHNTRPIYVFNGHKHDSGSKDVGSPRRSAAAQREPQTSLQRTVNMLPTDV